VEYLHPHRIGHGILCANDEALMRRVASDGIVLEICPTSNLRTRAVKGIEDLRRILDTLRAHNVAFTINTDGPQMLNTTVVKELRLLLDHGIFTEADVRRTIKTAYDASFLTRARVLV
jgi:adenosine deaminase